jgi:two-component system, sensor histidine kinase and response regulator
MTQSNSPSSLDQPTHSLSEIDVRGRKILIVDDDRLSIALLSTMLKSEGYELADADSGERALTVYDTFLPDLVLLDVMMPGMDGIETFRRLKDDYAAQCAPVFFITANNPSDEMTDCIYAGGADYLPKPFNTAEVRARVRTELRNQILIAQQSKLVTQLSAANADKDRLLTMAAQDMRTPLAAIHQLTQFLQSVSVGSLTPDQIDLINTIHDASQSMLGMVNDLLDLTAIESGEIKLQLGPFRLADLVEKSVNNANVYAAKKKTTIGLSPLPDGAETLAEIDAAKIKQVVDNLLSNAVKYSPPGSTIDVELRCDVARDAFSVAVRDQGPGIPEKERSKLFKDFSRLSAQPTGGEKSTGLGLAICRRIVEAHGGSITAENLPERGCEFRFVIPKHK